MMQKRVRTSWRMRRTFRLARVIAVLAGGGVGVAAVTQSWLQLVGAQAALSPDFVGQAVLVLLLSAGMPWVLLTSLWRRERSRHYESWQ